MRFSNLEIELNSPLFVSNRCAAARLRPVRRERRDGSVWYRGGARIFRGARAYGIFSARAGKTSYWDERYTKDPEPFDWYQRYSGIQARRGVLPDSRFFWGRLLKRGVPAAPSARPSPVPPRERPGGPRDRRSRAARVRRRSSCRSTLRRTTRSSWPGAATRGCPRTCSRTGTRTCRTSTSREWYEAAASLLSLSLSLRTKRHFYERSRSPR